MTQFNRNNICIAYYVGIRTLTFRWSRAVRRHRRKALPRQPWLRSPDGHYGKVYTTQKTSVSTRHRSLRRRSEHTEKRYAECQRVECGTVEGSRTWRNDDTIIIHRNNNIIILSTMSNRTPLPDWGTHHMRARTRL